jgi:hypothetical protein
LINRKTAERAGVEKVSVQPIGGIGDRGAAQGSSAFASKIQIGELQFENCYVEVVEGKKLDIDGLIGADVF